MSAGSVTSTVAPLSTSISCEGKARAEDESEGGVGEVDGRGGKPEAARGEIDGVDGIVSGTGAGESEGDERRREKARSHRVHSEIGAETSGQLP